MARESLFVVHSFVGTLLPYYAVTFGRATSVFENIPDFGRLSAKADGDALIEAANGTD